jgi:MerR family transcriptional regulator, light-induced transcriptional regulator
MVRRQSQSTAMPHQDPAASATESAQCAQEVLEHSFSVAVACAERASGLQRRGEFSTFVELRHRVEEGHAHLAHLAAAIAFDRPGIFADHVRWWLGRSLDRPPPQRIAELRSLAAELTARLRPASRTAVARTVEHALATTPQQVVELPSPVVGRPRAAAYLEALMRGDKAAALNLALEAIDGECPLHRVYLDVLGPALQEVGRLWQLDRLSVADEHYCTAVTRHVMSVLSARLAPQVTVRPRRGTLVATCPAGELHDLGARFMADLAEARGWAACYLGADAPAQDVVRTVIEQRADVLALSVSMVPRATECGALIAVLRALPECAHVHVVVGGRAFEASPGLWRQLGADSHAGDPWTALQRIEALLLRRAESAS